MSIISKLVSLALAVAGSVAPCGVSAASLTASLDRNVVPVGETFTLSVTVNGANVQSAPTLPALPGLTLLGVSPSLVVENGHPRFTFNHTLKANQTGDVTIPPIRMSIGGQAMATQPLQLKITPAGAAPNIVTNLAFVRLVVGKTNVYVGEAFPVEIHLYFRAVDDVRPQLKAEGFSLGQSADPQQVQTQVEGVAFNLLVFRSSASAARAGDLTLGPAECSLTVLVPVQRRRDFFDPFGMMASHQRRPTTLQSEAVAIRALPLPTENVPASFSGAVGTFNLNVAAAPTSVAVGDPITLKVNVSGNGRLDALSFANESQEWRNFNLYPPTKRIDASDQLALAGAVAFEQIVIPQNHEVRVLPPVEFSFFDPVQRQYRTLKGPAIPLTVRNAAVASVPPPAPTNSAASSEAPAADDILHIRAQFASGSASALLVRQPWFLGLQVAPVLAWLALLISRKRRESLANNPRRRRQREVAQRVREGFKELHQLAAAQNSDAFFATLFRLLQEQIGERLDVPASAITEAVIDERLRQSALPPAALASLHELFQLCNQARYAPQKSSQELSAIIPRAEAAVGELQKL